MIRAVLFDFDGVLVSTVETHAWAFREAVARVCPKVQLSEDDERYLNGLSTREKVRYLVRERGLPEKFTDRIWNLKQGLTLEAIHRNVHPDADKTEMLSALKRLDLRLACVSNAIRPSTVAALSMAGLIGFFEFVLTNEDVPKQKPDPAPYLEAMRRLDLPPTECLAVEDAAHGVESARKSGAYVLHAPSYREVTFRLVWDALRALDDISL